LISRRKFLSNSSVGLILTQLPSNAYAENGNKHYKLVAEPANHLFYPKAQKSKLSLYNKQCPGPTISAQKGDVLEVDFLNLLDEPTTIHWHGIRNLNDMDGVPGLTQPAVDPGNSYRYRFPLKDSGLFWYHAHSQAWKQVAKGLYGPLLVRDVNDETHDRDILLVIDDWLLDDRDQLQLDNLGSLHDWSHGGRHGNFLTLNGGSEPDIAVPASGQCQLRFLSAANARIMKFELNEKIPMKIVAIDGSPCAPFVVEELAVAPAQRYDILIEDSSQLEELIEVSTSQRLTAARFLTTQNTQSKSDIIPSYQPWYQLPQTTHAKIIDIHMQGGAMGNLGSALFEGKERSLRDLAQNEAKLWAFNGEIGGYGLALADVSLRDIVILRVWNDTRWRHAMHLHGQHFWVNSKEFGEQNRQVLRDTYLMQPSEKVDLVFIADNPGLWLFHCHMLEHHASGMGGVISVT
jgi:FtsP/CotA-like multicopper oxidase with cupredoxin domain